MSNGACQRACLTAALTLLLFVLPIVRAEEPHSAADEAIASALQLFVDNHTLAGAVTLVADKDKVLSLEAVGFADIAANKPMSTDALFWIASQSKPITATAFMMLVDKGKLKLDDPVSKYLPEFRDPWVAVYKDGDSTLLKRSHHPITIREILSHTSGLPFKSAIEEPTLDQLPLREAVRSYAMTPLLFEPGTKYQYSNAGINTAGRIIEVVSQMPYEEFLQKRLFDPLGMNDTTFWPSAAQVARIAKSYRPNKDGTGLDETTATQLKYPLSDREHRYPMPAGGLFSTASDLAKFCQMILNKGTVGQIRFLSENAIEEMTRKQTPESVKDNYGLGWSAGDTPGHGGAYSTNMTIDNKHGLILIWMVQHDRFPGNGNQSQSAFRQAAMKAFGNSSR